MLFYTGNTCPEGFTKVGVVYEHKFNETFSLAIYFKDFREYKKGQIVLYHEDVLAQGDEEYTVDMDEVLSIINALPTTRDEGSF